ncbi:MAG: anti-sigma factor antagonist [Candidatus Omnitrophota bacterium]
MEIGARKKGRIIILDLRGRVDVDSANFVEVVGQCVRDGYTDILCNLEAVDFIDYMGVSAIVIAYKEVVNNKGRMKFVNIPVHLKGLISVTGLDKTIDIYATEESAINSFKEDKILEDIKKMQLRRRFRRLPIDIKIELKAKHDRDATCLKNDLLDLSAVGAYIYGCENFKLGDELILKLKLTPDLDELVLDARVVWLSDKQIQHDLHPGMGIEFYNIPILIQQKLLIFIEKNLSFMSTDNQ